jgi:hypothetical protein
LLDCLPPPSAPRSPSLPPPPASARLCAADIPYPFTIAAPEEEGRRAPPPPTPASARAWLAERKAWWARLREAKQPAAKVAGEVAAVASAAALAAALAVAGGDSGGGVGSTEGIYSCEWGCGIRGSFEAVEAHEKTCWLLPSRQAGGGGTAAPPAAAATEAAATKPTKQYMCKACGLPKKGHTCMAADGPPIWPPVKKKAKAAMPLTLAAVKVVVAEHEV